MTEKLTKDRVITMNTAVRKYTRVAKAGIFSEGEFSQSAYNAYVVSTKYPPQKPHTSTPMVRLKVRRYREKLAVRMARLDGYSVKGDNQ